jgi:hypothetical protein
MTSFKALWGALKLELNLTDEDLDMGYKVRIDNGFAILGYLHKGKVSQTPTYYNHPSAAIKARDSFIKKTAGKLKCKILRWQTNEVVDL